MPRPIKKSHPENKAPRGPDKRESLRIATSQGTPSLPEMPLVHTSRCERIPEIIRAGAIRPTDCSVYAEPVAYLFYGRPAYRPGLNARPGDPITLCPVTFIFKPGALGSFGQRIYPCDTGAVSCGLFQPHV